MSARKVEPNSSQTDVNGAYIRRISLLPGPRANAPILEVVSARGQKSTALSMPDPTRSPRPRMLCPIPSKPTAEVSAVAFAAKMERDLKKQKKRRPHGITKHGHSVQDAGLKHGPHSRQASRAERERGKEIRSAAHLPGDNHRGTPPQCSRRGNAGAGAVSATPLLRFGPRLDVPPSGYVRSSIPEGRWRCTLDEAENHAMTLANDYLERARSARNRERALLPDYQARAQAHYDWDTAMETFSALTDDEDVGDPGNSSQASDTTRWQSLSREQQIVELTFGMTRHAWKTVQRAKLAENSVHLENFKLREAVANNYHNGPKIVQTVPVEETRATLLDGMGPRSIWSADDFPLVVHLPGALRGKTLDDVTDVIEEWGRVAKPSVKGANDMKDCYKQGYDLVGRTRLATLWHPVGHKHDPPVVCADVRKTGQSYEGAFKLFAELDLVNSFCTTALLAIDPLQYGLLRRVYDWRRETHKSQVAISALDKYNLWEGREIMFNRWSNPHWDHNDPHYSWACIVYFGTFTEARMKFRQLNAEVCLRRGDVVFLRGRDILHEVADWGDGERHFMVYFTHESLWDGAGIESRATPM